MELLVIGLLILLNGMFAMYEIALVSSRKSRLEEKAKSGHKGAATALNLMEEPEKILSAIQVGITLVGIVSGAYGGLTLADDFAVFLKALPWSIVHADTIAVFIVVGMITYFSIIIGELVPKTIALNNAEAITIFLSPLMKLFGSVTYPVIWFLSVSTKLILKLFNVKNKNDAPISDEELRILLRKGAEYGVFEKEESDIINEVIRFGDKRANALMIPRVEVVWIDIHQTTDKILQDALNSNYSLLPVCEDQIDNIKGVVSVKDLLAYYITHQTLRMEELLFEPLYIPEQALAPKVLEMFRQTKKYFGVVINEYGSIEGIITIHDLTENIMGDLPAMDDKVDREYFQREDGSYLIDGSMMIDDVEEMLEIESLFARKEEKPDVNTIGGLAMYALNRIPNTGDKFEAGGYSFEVIDMDGKRVDKLLVKTTVKDVDT
jgi:putative hemolysin